MNRRLFLATAPGLGLLVTQGLSAQLHTHAMADPFMEVILAEHRRLLTDRLSAPGREIARRYAAMFRLQAAYLRDRQIDGKVQRYTANQLRAKGIAAFIDDLASPQAVQRRRAEFATHFPGHQPPTEDAPNAAVLQQLAAGTLRFSDVLMTLGTEYDGLALRLARQEIAPGVTVRPVQQGDCTLIRRNLDILGTVMNATCGLAWIEPLLIPACLSAIATYEAWKWAVANSGC